MNLKVLLSICAAVLGLAALFILATIVVTLVGGAGLPDVLPLLSVLGVFTGAAVALIAFLTNLIRARSQDYLTHSIDLLERAYRVLAPDDPSADPPNRRENWIAAARFLKSSAILSREIAEPSHRRVYEETLLDWRLRFSQLISPSDDGFPPEYFAARPQDVFAWNPRRTRAPLSTTSLAVLYRFIRIPDDYRDPLHSEPSFTPAEIHRMKTFGPKGLGRHLEMVNEVGKSGRIVDPDVFEFAREDPDENPEDSL